MNMLFTNPRKYVPSNPQPQQSPIIYYQPSIRTKPSVIVEKVHDKPEPKKMKWGEPTWFLFHTLAEKVNEKSFPKIRDELLKNVVAICGNLPCPTCASHASEYMKKVQVNSIRTKQDLKMLFYKFHNEVNQKKGVGVFPYEQLDEKYSKANTLNIIQYFLQHFKDTHSSIHMIANDMHRLRVTKKLYEWFHENIQHFSP